MDEKKMKIIENFKEELRKRIVGIWWIICAIFLTTVMLFCYFNIKDIQKNLKIFAALTAGVLFFLGILTVCYYFSYRKKFFKILNLLDEEDLLMVEKLYMLANIYGHKNMGIITKEGILSVL